MRILNTLRLVLFFIVSFAVMYADPNAKIVYVNVAFPQTDKSFYVGQNIEVKYTLTLLSNATLNNIEWVNLDKSNLTLKNKNAKWVENADGSFSNTYIYRIIGKDVTIPQLRISASSGDYTEEIVSNGAKLQAVELTSNQRYNGVIASEFNVVDYRAKEFDEENNIVIFQFEAKDANLSAMKIGEHKMQGLESSKVLEGITYGIYYIVLDKSQRQVSFEYFNLLENQFVDISIPINIVRNNVDEVGDIKPRNTFLMFKNLLIGGAIGFFAFVWLIFKRLRKVSFGIIVLLLLLLGYSLFFSATSGVAQAGAQISIVPTRNSTITEVISAPTKIDIIGEYEDYYKIMVDSRVGWIRKEYVSKN